MGNPPWERIKLQEQEFFATRDSEIANAPNKAARTKLINELKETNLSLYEEFQNAKHDSESSCQFIRESEIFPLTGTGDVNTYALFAELARKITSGRLGLIVPTGIATDNTFKNFFGSLSKEKALASLYDFENRDALFPGVHRSYKFCLITLSRSKIEEVQYAFFLTQVDQLNDKERKFIISNEDISLINPNTRTIPVFRTKVDTVLTKKIYRKIAVLAKDMRYHYNP